MHSPPKPVLLLFLPFFFSFSCYWVHSCSPLTLSILYSLFSALHPICCCAGLTLSSPAQPVPPTLPKTRYPHGGTAGCFPHLFLGPLSTVSGKNSNSVSLSFSISVNRFLLLSYLPAMSKDTSSAPSVAELNACVSPSGGGHNHRPAAKETTFREWMVANQIGMRLHFE